MFIDSSSQIHLLAALNYYIIAELLLIFALYLLTLLALLKTLMVHKYTHNSHFFPLTLIIKIYLFLVHLILKCESLIFIYFYLCLTKTLTIVFLVSPSHVHIFKDKYFLSVELLYLLNANHILILLFFFLLPFKCFQHTTKF